MRMPRVCSFKAIKVFEQGKRNAAVWQLLRDNIRISDLVVGDMEAQVAACRIGAQRYIELIERYGSTRSKPPAPPCLTTLSA